MIRRSRRRKKRVLNYLTVFVKFNSRGLFCVNEENWEKVRRGGRRKGRSNGPVGVGVGVGVGWFCAGQSLPCWTCPAGGASSGGSPSRSAPDDLCPVSLTVSPSLFVAIRACSFLYGHVRGVVGRVEVSGGRAAVGTRSYADVELEISIGPARFFSLTLSQLRRTSVFPNTRRSSCFVLRWRRKWRFRARSVDVSFVCSCSPV